MINHFFVTPGLKISTLGQTWTASLSNSLFPDWGEIILDFANKRIKLSVKEIKNPLFLISSLKELAQLNSLEKLWLICKPRYRMNISY